MTQEKGRTFAQVKPVNVKQLVIPKNLNPNNYITKKVDQILAAKKKDTDADTSVLEKEIDRMVYKLYGLTEEEIEIVENS